MTFKGNSLFPFICKYGMKVIGTFLLQTVCGAMSQQHCLWTRKGAGPTGTSLKGAGLAFPLVEVLSRRINKNLILDSSNWSGIATRAVKYRPLSL